MSDLAMLTHEFKGGSCRANQCGSDRPEVRDSAIGIVLGTHRVPEMLVAVNKNVPDARTRTQGIDRA
jgi:hypothetical protein